MSSSKERDHLLYWANFLWRPLLQIDTNTFLTDVDEHVKRLRRSPESAGKSPASAGHLAASGQTPIEVYDHD